MKDPRFKSGLIYQLSLKQISTYSSNCIIVASGAVYITCPLVFGHLEMSHVIFLMLKTKEMLAKLSKFPKKQ